jgi:SAM-dependent methyltransferase
MNKTEFDKYAENYASLHQQNIKITGESPGYFYEYKIIDTAKIIIRNNLSENIEILDFGCGIGNSIPFFQKHLPAAIITGIDISKYSIDIAKKMYSDYAKFVIFDGKQIPFDENSYDVVFSSCVFHHIPHHLHEYFFVEIYRIIKPGGLVLIFEHNPINPLTCYAVKNCPMDDNAVLINANKLKDTIENAGFINTRVVYRIFFPRILKFLRPIEYYLKTLPFGAQYYVSAIKGF